MISSLGILSLDDWNFFTYIWGFTKKLKDEILFTFIEYVPVFAG